MSALTTHSAGGDRSMTIGEVLALLRQDFDDITISKIRFLEAEGLVAPQRAPSGYRRFRADDVERLRLVLLAQRDHYLPLRVIKERLEAGELAALVSGDAPAEDTGPDSAHPRGEVEVEVEGGPGETAGDAAGRTANGAARQPDIDPREVFSRGELAHESQLPVDVIKQLEYYGVICPDPAGRFSGAHVLVCRAYATLRGHGVDERHLRQVKNGASRDASLIGQSVVHLQADDRTEAESHMLQAFSDAHYWLVMSELNTTTPPSSHHRPRSRR